MSSANGPMPVSGEIERRGRRGWSLALCAYVGIPLVFLGVLAWIRDTATQEPHRLDLNYQVLIFPLIMLVIGFFLARRNRYRPAKWSSTGWYFGAIAGLITAFYTLVIGLHWLAALFPLTAAVGAGLGWAIGRSGERTITTPAIPELGESPYELVYRLRSPRNVRITIGAETVSIKERISRAPGDRSQNEGPDYPLTSITATHEVHLTGAERLKFPANFRTAPFGTPGPALILQARGADWVLPLNEAGGISQIITRRAAAANRTL